MDDRADISDAAREVRGQLIEAGIVIPTAQNYLQYRQDLVDGSADMIAQLEAGFDGVIEEIETAGVTCLQLTPAGWSEAAGPVIQYAYGGGYVSGSTGEDQGITVPLASAATARVVMVDYRLSPEHPFPAAQQDMQAVYPALLDQYGAARLVVSGESAGGNQTLQLLQHARDHGLAMPACAIVLSPWIDLTHQGDSHDINGKRDPSLSTAWLDSAATLHANGHPLDDPGISPLFGGMRGLPPTMITTGSLDCLLSDCLRLARKLRDAGVECDLRVWEGMWHVFEFYPIPEARQSIAEMADFIQSNT